MRIFGKDSGVSASVSVAPAGAVPAAAGAPAAARWRPDRAFFISCAISIGILLVSLVVSYLAAAYATLRAGSAVPDIILSNIRVYDVDWMFIYGPLIFWIGVTALLLYRPQKIPYALKAISLFVLIRSLFVILTHFGPFPTRDHLDPTSFIFMFTSGADLFFSAHTGLPFLLALMFWDEVRLRIVFIASSILFGVVVLLGHFHYSIDVLAAFFITYTINHIAQTIFPKDLKLFKTVKVLRP